MTKKINRLARVFIVPSLFNGTAAFAICSITIAPLNRYLFSFSSAYRPGPSIFTALFATLSCCFFEFSFAVRQTRFHSCFSGILAFFFITPLLTNPHKHPVVVDTVVANRSRLRVTNVSGPIDVGPLLFCDRSLVPSSIVKFDEKQRLHDDRKQRRYFLIQYLL